MYPIDTSKSTLLFQLNERGEGIVLEGLNKHVHKLKVIYEVLEYYRIPAVIKTENGIVDPSKIDKRECFYNLHFSFYGIYIFPFVRYKS